MAEEVKDPDRNIPLGMTLTLISVTAVYVIGVFIMVLGTMLCLVPPQKARKIEAVPATEAASS